MYLEDLYLYGCVSILHSVHYDVQCEQFRQLAAVFTANASASNCMAVLYLTLLDAGLFHTAFCSVLAYLPDS
jgi:hypothetical protein